MRAPVVDQSGQRSSAGSGTEPTEEKVLVVVSIHDLSCGREAAARFGLVVGGRRWRMGRGRPRPASGAPTWVRDAQTLAPAPPLLSSSPCAQRGGWGLCRGEEKVCEAHMTSSQSLSPPLLYLSPLLSP